MPNEPLLIAGPAADASPIDAGTARAETSPEARSTKPARAILKDVMVDVAEHPAELAKTLDGFSEGLVAFDAQRKILHANRRAEELFGYERGALADQSTDSLIPARLRQPNAPPMVATADIMQVELPGLRREGVELPVEWTFGATGKDQPIFVMMVRDRNAIERALEALKASEERFRLLVEGVREYALFMLDANGRVSSWNKGAERNKGWSESEILGQSYSVFFTPEDRASHVPEKLLASAAREGIQEVSGWRVRKDGTRYFVTAYLTALHTPEGELRGFAKVTRDLTEVLRAEESEQRLLAERTRRENAEAAELRIRASEERLRRLQKVTAALSEAATPLEVAAVILDQCLLELDAAAGVIYTVSRDGSSLQMLDQRGHPSEPLIQYSSFPLEGQFPLSDAVRDGEGLFFSSFDAFAAKYPHLREAIRAGDFEASVALPLATHGARLGALGLRFHQPREFDENDKSLLLTLSKLCAQALERARLFGAESQARAEAEAASRSKDEFLAMLGHELRNPLAPIVTALHLMKLRGGEAVERERTVIERQVTHLTRLVDDLLDVSRITQGKVELKKKRVELAEVVARAIEIGSPLLEQRHHHLSISVPSEGLLVEVDATRLSQVISNLLNNAAKYTQPGGHIDIAAVRRDGSVALTVRDDGIGISKGMLPRVFDLFAQERQGIDRSQGGLGLGLAIVKSIVVMHGGKVSAESSGHGKGSLFTVELPLAEGAEPAPPARAARSAQVAASKLRVLIVDDNSDAATLLADGLRLSGYEVATASDGPEALLLALKFKPQVALLDIGLPVMDGYELAHRLRELNPIRLIAVTGYGQEEDRSRAHQAGFDAHLVKPISLDRLIELVG